MSRIYFHSPSGTAEVAGSEQHHVWKLVYDRAISLLEIRDEADTDRLLRLLPPDHHMRIIKRSGDGWLPTWASFFHTAWRITGEDFVWRGRPLDPMSISLNTALEADSDPWRLVARMAAQNEIHGWVDGPNRKWLADLINEALDAGLLRRTLRPSGSFGEPKAKQAQGWEGVTKLLRSRDDEAVVTFYSVTGGFPDRDIATWDQPVMPDGWQRPGWTDAEWQQLDEDERAEYFEETAVGDAWAALSDAERWAAGMAGLREDPGRLELRPEDWAGYWFGNGVTVFDLNASDWEQRLDEAFGIESETVEVG